ncbi:MAG TPA: thiamine pyrophosphate-requiring protein [Gammaproteobacteria bacterium]|nr:thiamine pyrophosphate-requiring protein [Gammaproteobacteria bacterium]
MSADPKDLAPQRAESPDNMTAAYWLEAMNEVGVDYLFCNMGTDHAPIIETMAQWQQQGKKFPKVILTPHENTAMHMAIGYYRMTGRAQAVLVHVDAGTANAAMAMHNAFRSRVPVVLMAGTAPVTVRGELLGTRDTYVHFIQDPYDMKGIVRNYVKWEYQLPTGVVVKEAIRRAFTMAESDPPGPVFMTLPREILAETWEPEQVASFSNEQYGPMKFCGVDDAVLEGVADRLLAAKNPLLITSYAGRNEATPAVIDELCQLTGTGVIASYPQVMNLSVHSPVFLGNLSEAHLPRTDFGLMVDTDLPWMPKEADPNPDTYWVQIDIDPIKNDIPMWGFPSNEKIQGDSYLILSRLLEICKAKITDAQKTAAEGRLAEFATQRDEAVVFIENLANDKGTPGLINPAYLCAELNKVLDEDDILVSEAVMNEPSVAMQIARTKPGTVMGLGGGGLGYSPGSALGAKLAKPDSMVLHLSGDGSFYFGNPSSTYEVAREHGLPIFTVVFENGGWSAVKECTIKVHPDGISRDTDEFQARLNPSYQFEKLVEAAGGHGEDVVNPDDLPAAIGRCVEAVKSGRSAILVAHVSRL